MKVLNLYYPAQDRIISFERIDEGLRIDIKSEKKVIAGAILSEQQIKILKQWIKDESI